MGQLAILTRERKAPGLHPGDVVQVTIEGDLVLRVNGVSIDSAARLETIVRALPPDSTVLLQVKRDNAAIELRVPPAPAQ